MASSARINYRPKGLSRRSRAAAKAGWTPERRARQAVLIRDWQPWRRSTGPKTEGAKAHCAMNALKHGFRSRASIREFHRIRYAIRLAAFNNERLRAFIRNRNARPRIRIKPAYVKLWLARRSGLLALVTREPNGRRRNLSSVLSFEPRRA